jgi:putative cardiolipin synthase
MGSRGGHEFGTFVLVAAAQVLAGCAMLPKYVVRPISSALVATQDTALGRLVVPTAVQHPSESGFLLFDTGEGAIQARVALADVAQSSIDAQYFEWAGDAVGRVLLDRVIAAADQGVRVRLLIDDYHARGRDIAFQVLDAHPNIEVRVFNPFVRGRLRLPQLIGRFTELNHRMHNKMFIVDGQAAVVGGRNLTDDYFGMGRAIDFRDFDLLAIGAVVPRAEAAFDLYWNSEWAYPITVLRKPASTEALRRARARFDAHVAADRIAFPYSLPRDHDDALGWLERFRGKLIWAPAEVVYDDPSLMAKPLHSQVTAVGRTLITLTERAREEIVGENAYLVPHENLALLRATLARGVKVRLLTNSLASTDVVLVNAAYAKSRPTLAELGVALYEMKPYGTSRALYVARPAHSRAHLALHGKAAVFDREVVFLGSFNLDPRSMYLDTEAVFVVHSAALAEKALQAFAPDFAASNAWHIGHVVGKHEEAWITEWPMRADVEPHDPASLWRRILRSLAKLLPVRPYL